jgi:RNA polymerase sigma-70 factor, ECF subfamily
MSDDASGADRSVEVFERERRRLFGVAYRMLGTHADADDVVQEAWLRFSGSTTTIENPAAWLTTVVTRLSVDELRAARRTRASYVGPWLAEPALDLPDAGSDPAERSVMLESITLGFLAVLERLSPLERAVFVLHDVFALPLTDVAEVIERSDDATRQLATRARGHLAADRARFEPEPDDARRLTEMLLAAAATGDLRTIGTYLTRDVVAVSDGGAARRAARRPVVGAERVARYVTNLAGRLEPDTEVHLVLANGQTALYLTQHDEPVMLVVPSWYEGRVRAVHSLLNPDKLASFHRAWRAAH